MAVKVLATGASPDFVNSVMKIVPATCTASYCPAVYQSLREAVDVMSDLSFFLLCLDKENDNTVSNYRRVIQEGLMDNSEIVIVGKPTACRVLAKDPVFLDSHFFERPINVNDFCEFLSNPPEKKPEPEAEPSSEPARLEPEYAMSQRRHILIVDDELQQVLLIKSLLIGYYDITAVTNGDDARKYLSRHKVDLILMDYVMPGEDGSKIFAGLKSDPDTAHIPVVFLTAINDADTVRKIISLRPAGYLVKPVKRSDLVSRIIDILDSQDSAKKK